MKARTESQRQKLPKDKLLLKAKFSLAAAEVLQVLRVYSEAGRKTVPHFKISGQRLLSIFMFCNQAFQKKSRPYEA